MPGIFTVTQSGDSSSYGNAFKPASGTTFADSFSIDASHSHTLSGNTSATGKGVKHNNIPPYVVVYMWRRTA